MPIPPPMHSDAESLVCIAPAHFVQQRRQDAAVRRTDRVAERDRAADGSRPQDAGPREGYVNAASAMPAQAGHAASRT
jgi:hypothetical protein